ncbi:MAG: carbamoyltransferase HypF [Gemmatimonadaceae bacterium]
MAQRVRLRIEGTVQGVGFRPYVYRLARSLELTGFVRNDASGVLVEIEGGPDSVAAFIERLPAELPSLASCDSISAEELTVAGEHSFSITESDGAGASPPTALVAPDTATCADCLRELFDPADRRYRYPFINCTNCGPRFTIVRGIPYDRPLTTMAGFAMCSRCNAEYHDPGDRRFHAQPNACSECGPSARLTDSAGEPIGTGGARDAVESAALALRDGAIVAVKGVGGYHLACRADDEGAVQRLRDRKHRAEKPFAIMARDLDAARNLVELDAIEARLITSRERPIVLGRRRADAAVAAAVAPFQRDLGVMLPYSPLHQLLMEDTGTPLVLTSGNMSDEPIANMDDDALTRLARVADYFLWHDRPIQTRTDDSVMRVVTIGGERRPVMLRRSRGYVPVPIALGTNAPAGVLACGAQLKNTICLARGDRAWVGPHVGDLENYETLQSFVHGIDDLERLCAVVPRHIAHDLHPEYLSTKYAVERGEREAEVELDGVQHHHAHLAACLAEHGERGPALGVIFDGTGYGSDGTVWGGEILLGDLRHFERVGHLWPVSLPGGAAAVREPWRMACAWLVELSPGGGVPDFPLALTGRVDPKRWDAVARLARSPLSLRTTSAGRLLDGVAALCGVGASVSYEGQAAIELEMIADVAERGHYAVPICGSGGNGATGGELVLDVRELVREVVRDVAASVPVSIIAARVHNGVAYAAVAACVKLARARNVDTVVLSGGVFQNVLLLERTAEWLEQEGLRVLVPEILPVNDGGISYGQAAVAVARMRAS